MKNEAATAASIKQKCYGLTSMMYYPKGFSFQYFKQPEFVKTLRVG